jgi:hypothetical protein
VDLKAEACGVSYDHAVAKGIERRTVEGVEIPIATRGTLIRTKATVQDSDRSDVGFLQDQIEREKRQRNR